MIQIAAMTNEFDGIIGLYRRHAKTWTCARAAGTADRPMEAAWLDQFLRLMPSRPDVLDLGCGSGVPIGRYLGMRGCTLTGVDAAPEMIALWAERLPGHAGLVADMRSLALPRAFDGILAWDSFFHLCHDDQRRMFAVFRAHARPGAALMFTSGPSHGVALGTLGGELLYHASLDPAEYRSQLGEHGFRVVAHRAEDPNCGGRTIWLAQRSGDQERAVRHSGARN